MHQPWIMLPVCEERPRCEVGQQAEEPIHQFDFDHGRKDRITRRDDPYYGLFKIEHPRQVPLPARIRTRGLAPSQSFTLLQPILVWIRSFSRLPKQAPLPFQNLTGPSVLVSGKLCVGGGVVALGRTRSGARRDSIALFCTSVPWFFLSSSLHKLVLQHLLG